jgi:hypothetical protein
VKNERIAGGRVQHRRDGGVDCARAMGQGWARPGFELGREYGVLSGCNCSQIVLDDLSACASIVGAFGNDADVRRCQFRQSVRGGGMSLPRVSVLAPSSRSIGAMCNSSVFY